MQISLYKAAEEVRDLLDQIDSETGELPEGFQDARAIVSSKAQAVAAFILDTEKTAAMVMDHAKDLTAKAKQMQKRADWLRTYLRENMSSCGITEIKSDDGTFRATLSVGRDESVEIFEPALVPMDYQREIPAKYEPDKTLIKQACNDGFEVPGARIVRKDRLTIK